MDKKSVQAVAVTIFSGVLFLESMFAGGVASEETGKVLDGMRGLRRVNRYCRVNGTTGIGILINAPTAMSAVNNPQ